MGYLLTMPKSCAKAEDFVFSPIEYFLQPNKCIKRKIRIHCSKKKKLSEKENTEL
jgi:hypothetical protein